MSEILTKLEGLPEFLSSHDLVALGLFPSPDSVYLARFRGNSPDYCKFGRKIRYPKQSVIDFIESRMKRGDVPKMCNGKEDTISVVHS